MSFHHLDQYARVHSPLTHIAPTARLAGTIVLALGAALLPLGAWLHMALLIALSLAMVRLARIPARAFLARIAGPFGFVVLVSLAVLVLAPGKAILDLGPIAVTDAGLLRFLSAVSRAAAALTAAIVLVSTTRFPEMVEALRGIGLPRPVTMSLGLAYRYVYVLFDEIEQLRRAARSRNAAGGAVSRRRLITGVTAAAFTRSIARSERIYQAMLSRGYSGALPSLAPQRLDRRSMVTTLGLALAVGLIVLTARL